MVLSHPREQVRFFTRDIEFDYIAWTLDAFAVKLQQISLNTVNYLDSESQRQIVLDYIDLIQAVRDSEGKLNNIYSQPGLENREELASQVSAELEELYTRRTLLGPLAESVLQNMLAEITAQTGFNLLGQQLPPALYHSTPLPWALIVSPREVIQQDHQISLQTELNVEQHVELEEEISEALDVSTLIVPVGGIGTYPAMIAESTNLVWIAEVIAHEWIHNFLTIRPLGALYGKNPELRTINETSASLAGVEIGNALIAEFFPELLPPASLPAPQEDSQNSGPPPPPPDPPGFDFRAEMHQTRITTDELLSQGKIDAAEAYMEIRRQVFWDNGFQIRKLNQAYFAFYGAYADVPGGAAGEDPVGAAVRELREESDSLRDFITTIAWVTSFEELESILKEIPAP